MDITEVRDIAKKHGITAGYLFKTELIRSIQTREGNFNCYATAYDGVCDQLGCIWREDCFEAARKDRKM
ncbi:MAG: SAP domain-containing protein [Gammaproteobacteria bacterium]|nr:SAP domain-containing protein [Gammaproteobacteria bacterium]MBU1970129.1 SAP domain-containing protein [Gammaproteobacteria bacterium]